MSDRGRPLLLLLLGGRIQPAAMAIQHFRPAAIGCVASADTPERVEAIRGVVAHSLPDAVVLSPELVPPYEPIATREAIRRLVEQMPDRPVLVSLTGGSMPMVLGGYEMARSRGWPAYYQDTASGQLVDMAAEHGVMRIDPQVMLMDYLAIYNARLNPNKTPSLGALPPERHRAAMRCMVREPAVTAELLGWLFAGKKSSTIRLRTLLWSLNDVHWALLCDLAELNIVRDVARRKVGDGERVQVRVSDVSDLAFLNGRWLEQYVYTAAQSARLEGRPLFDDCAHSVHFLSGGAPRELDFAGVRSGRLLAGSCKTSKNPWDKLALDELVSVVKSLGDNFCIRIFVTNQMRPQGNHRLAASFAEFAEQARTARVAIVTGDDLPGLSGLLAEQMKQPTYASN